MADANPPSTNPALKQATDAATVAKAQAEARKLAADADVAEVTARTAILKAAIGELPTSGVTGAVVAGEGAAIAEQYALARKALLAIAARVVTALPATKLGTGVLLSAADAVPSRGVAQSFALRAGLIKRGLGDAIDLSKKLDGEVNRQTRKAKGFVGALATGTAASLVFSSINTALGYLKSDVALAGKPLDASDRPLLTELAGLLAGANVEVRVEGSAPAISTTTIDKLTNELAELSALAADARFRSATHAAQVKLLSPKPAPAPALPPAPVSGAPSTPLAISTAVTATPSAVDPDPDGKRPLHERAVQALDVAVALFDDLFKALLAETGGATLMQRIAEARELDAFLASGTVLLLKVDGCYATTQTEKGFLKGLFGVPAIKVGTLVLISWRLCDGATARILAAGCEQELVPLQDVYADASPALFFGRDRPAGALADVKWRD